MKHFDERMEEIEEQATRFALKWGAPIVVIVFLACAYFFSPGYKRNAPDITYAVMQRTQKTFIETSEEHFEPFWMLETSVFPNEGYAANLTTLPVYLSRLTMPDSAMINAELKSVELNIANKFMESLQNEK